MGIAGILAAGCGAAGAVVGMAEVYDLSLLMLHGSDGSYRCGIPALLGKRQVLSTVRTWVLR